jgi:2-aminomuconate deaminase
MGKPSRSIPTSSCTIHISDIATILPDGTVAGVDDGATPDSREQTPTILATIENIIRGHPDPEE